jgi:hypothetical protein
VHGVRELLGHGHFFLKRTEARLATRERLWLVCQHCSLEMIKRDDLGTGAVPVKLAAEVRRAGGQQIILDDGGQGVLAVVEL